MAIRIENTADYTYMHADSVADLIELARNPGRLPANNRARYLESIAEHASNAGSWYGVPAHSIADTLETGWRNGAERLSGMQRPEVGIGRSNRRRRVRGDHGDSLDPHAVMRGDLGRAWERTKRTETKSPLFVTVWANLGLQAGISAESAFLRGAAIVAICDALTLAGHQVEVIGYRYSRNNTFKANKSKHHAYFVPLKRFDDRLDIELLATVSCLAGFHRSAGFAAIAASPNQIHEAFGRSEQGGMPPRKIIDAHGAKHNVGVPLFENESQMRQWLGDWEREFNNEHTNRDDWR